jgi:hypothetical protein
MFDVFVDFLSENAGKIARSVWWFWAILLYVRYIAYGIDISHWDILFMVVYYIRTREL